MMTHHVMIGVQLLSQLVCEMNQVSEVWFCIHYCCYFSFSF